MNSSIKTGFIIFFSLLAFNGLQISSRVAFANETHQILIPAGTFIMGSDRAEKEYGYTLDESRNSSASRRYRWFENEAQETKSLPDYYIDRNLVSNKDYSAFINATQHSAPHVDKTTWQNYKLIHPYSTAKKYLWHNNQIPEGRIDHPVVLVDQHSAQAYCAWRGARLPSEAEWEKAARGANGNYFPWGNQFDPTKLNSADDGPFDTASINHYNNGASPYGVLNMAGMVFEWTSTVCPSDNRPNASIVKGGSWDDFPGVTRSAAKHCRPNNLKHVLVGFRCAATHTTE